VYFIEDFLESTANPPYEGEVKYGDRAEHCWNGDPALPKRPLATALQHDVPAQNARADGEDRAAWRRSEKLALLTPAQFVRQNNRFRQFFHGALEAAALISHAEVGFSADVYSCGLLMHVHNADYVAAADKRHRKHRLVGVLDEVLDVLEARIGGSIGRKRHGVGRGGTCDTSLDQGNSGFGWCLIEILYGGYALRKRVAYWGCRVAAACRVDLALPTYVSRAHWGRVIPAKSTTRGAARPMIQARLMLRPYGNAASNSATFCGKRRTAKTMAAERPNSTRLSGLRR
jgi:hypothetical protein